MRDYIVFDLEWNQCPQGKEESVEHLPFEIIEIGAVKMDEQFHIVSEYHALVKPKVYQELHYKISEVTHMNIVDLNRDGRSFPQVMDEFLEWCGESAVFCTWGSMDLTELQRNMVYYGMELPFECPLLYYDIQKLFSLEFGGGKDKVSLDTAVEFLQLEEDRPFHRALDDAYYTGCVLALVDFDKVKPYQSVDYFRIPETKEEELYLVFPGYSKYVSRGYESKEDAMKEKEVTDFRCYQCNRLLRKKIRWFPANQKIYYGLGWCPEHGYLKGKIRIKRAESGQVYVVKTLKLVEESGAELITKKRDLVRRRRAEKNHTKKLR